MPKIKQLDWSKLQPKQKPRFKTRTTSHSFVSKKYWDVKIKDRDQDITHSFTEYALTQKEANALALKRLRRETYLDNLEVV